MSLLEGFRAVSFKSYLLDLLDAITSLQEVDSSLARTMQSYDNIYRLQENYFIFPGAGW